MYPLDIAMMTDVHAHYMLLHDGPFFAGESDDNCLVILAEAPLSQDFLGKYKFWCVEQSTGKPDAEYQTIVDDTRFVKCLNFKMRALLQSKETFEKVFAMRGAQGTAARKTVAYLYKAWTVSDEDSRKRFVAYTSTVTADPTIRPPPDPAPVRPARVPAEAPEPQAQPTARKRGRRVQFPLNPVPDPVNTDEGVGEAPAPQAQPTARKRGRRVQLPLNPVPDPVNTDEGAGLARAHTLLFTGATGRVKGQSSGTRRFITGVESGQTQSTRPLRFTGSRLLTNLGIPWLTKRVAKKRADYVLMRIPNAFRSFYRGQIQDVTFYSTLAAYPAWVINDVLRAWTDNGEEADIVDIWLALHASSCRIRLLEVSFQEILDSQRTQNPETALRACFICLSPRLLKHMGTLEDGRKVCRTHIERSEHTSKFSLSTNIPVATKPTRDIVFHDDDAQPLGRYGRITSTILSSTEREGAAGSAVVSQGRLYNFARSFFTDPKLGIWWDPWTEEKVSEFEDRVGRTPPHPFAASLDCLDPMAFVDNKALMHFDGNTSIMLLMFNYMKGSTCRTVVSLMGMAARQTATERAKRALGEVNWHDQAFWDWFHNAMAHLHFLAYTYPYRLTARFSKPIPDHDTQEQFAISMKTGRYSHGGEAAKRVRMKTKSRRPESLPYSTIFPQLQCDWFTPRFIDMTDQIERESGVQVPRWGDSRLPWTFIENHQPPGEIDPGRWWTEFMLGYFHTARTVCDRRNVTLVDTESPLTFGLVFVVDFCEQWGSGDFIHCKMTPYAKSAISASNGRLTTVEPLTPFASGFTDPWPSSFRDQYEPSKRTFGPQPLAFNRLLWDFPRFMHEAMFDELCKLKEGSKYCPAPAKDLEFLDYQKLISIGKATTRGDIDDDGNLDEDGAPLDDSDSDEDDGQDDDEDDEDAVLVDDEDGDFAPPDDDQDGDGDADADEMDSNPRTRLERMQREMDVQLSEVEGEGLMEDPVVAECFAFMRQSIRDDHEASFELMAGRLVEYLEPGRRAPPSQAEMEKELELLEVGIQNMALQLGGFTATMFTAHAGAKAKDVRAAIDARSFKQHSMQKDELKSLLQGGLAEMKSRAAEAQSRAAEAQSRAAEEAQSRAEAMAKSNRIAVLSFERGQNEKTMESVSKQLEELRVRTEELRVRNEERHGRNEQIDEELARLRE
ncbi:hypothetical protein TI39_contig4109g00006 [Zymoseptoria brevis]|uniref:Uncharacterized protein n=1 Tax=Zymoseptoria brevis TaxID=1047168 RepID=A0A0F4GDW0_9PEZI|nr:hypothetical protein TI39_contig4109g00006 [Zymoseptoria brevis]